jgi:hypothetical protein
MTDYTELASAVGGLAGAGAALYFGQPELVPFAAGAGSALGGSMAAAAAKNHTMYKQTKTR